MNERYICDRVAMNRRYEIRIRLKLRSFSTKAGVREAQDDELQQQGKRALAWDFGICDIIGYPKSNMEYGYVY